VSTVKDKEVCKRCNFVEWCAIKDLRLTELDDSCPCKECLVKPMCKLMCDKRIGIWRIEEERRGVKWEKYPVENV
jgi:hypothetical protein